MTTVAPENITDTPPPPLQEGRLYAFFFDVDGTLAALQAEPDAVSIPLIVRDRLLALSQATDGALALVSGRPIAQLDALSAPHRFPLAGVHGAERRDAESQLHRVTLSEKVVTPLQNMLQQGMSAMQGTLLEAKGMAFALHYRQAPAFEHQVLALAESAVEKFPGLQLQPGKCVVEIKPQGTDKGAAIRAFMQELPFKGRIPVFVGDDLTDEKGFLAVNAMQGISVKVGEGAGHAHYRLNDVADVYDWLEQLLSQIKHNNVGKGSRL
ncbi:trehalose-phosphatase [Rouxiella badensis]|uniref:Trehalose 6-phosphate phosphatase n=1 Tax=Rouxiella badensis TaxID=1646377 RepID=A0A1X0WJJ4_9GAMM|nr:trehalose-phosphatase [Rouxiella badensis]MCC3702546.1 trehalose-phosphatase [Rouxiella badensis]MCC3718729.1 trehalose-phosphatase [Rouxiella badensis]MCC3727932.1 trehalose-phosphatase [Rouxiella badensis]MCC3732900.1 trehalose-phosphatase [Rouxiella badensis]MCC3739676.1 trehalose-phosphatase [Rouxiella badensis]